MKGRKMSAKEQMEKLESDKNERRKIFRELCNHVSAGYSLESFAPLSLPAIKRYQNLYIDDFPGDELEHALRRGRLEWESIGKRQSTGDCLGNSRSWYYNMANRYGWRDKLDVEAEHKGSVNVNVVSYASQRAPQHNEDDVRP